MTEERPPIYTMTLRSGEQVTLERLQAGVYRSGCGRYLYLDRDRDGERELVNHRNGRYAIRRLRKGWQVLDLLTVFELGEEELAYPLYHGGYPETLEIAVGDVPRRQQEIDEKVAQGRLKQRREPLVASEALPERY